MRRGAAAIIVDLGIVICNLCPDSANVDKTETGSRELRQFGSEAVVLGKPSCALVRLHGKSITLCLGVAIFPLTYTSLDCIEMVQPALSSTPQIIGRRPKKINIYERTLQDAMGVPMLLAMNNVCPLK